jgi:hypothetical protein
VQLIVAVLLSSTASARVEKPSCERPSLELVRYDEDWSFLRDPRCRTDVWDPLKYVALDAGMPAYLSLGVEIREWYEYYHNPDWGRAPRDHGYSLQRYLLHGDLHIGSHVRAFIQLGSHLEYGRAGGPRPAIDEDLLDLQQAFMDLSFDVPRAGRFIVRAGRQELEYGKARLIAVRENANLRLRFDGVRLMQSAGEWRIDAFALVPVQASRGGLDAY